MDGGTEAYPFSGRAKKQQTGHIPLLKEGRTRRSNLFTLPQVFGAAGVVRHRFAYSFKNHFEHGPIVSGLIAAISEGRNNHPGRAGTGAVSRNIGSRNRFRSRFPLNQKIIFIITVTEK